jgi:hypothetical protein
MWNIFSQNKNKENKEVKAFLIKEFFNSANQKKVITRAARESAEDQRLLVAKYHELVKTGV